MSDDSHDPYQGMTREEYLQDLSEQYDIPIDAVMAIAEVLGPVEDFDGLVAMLQDIESGFDIY